MSSIVTNTSAMNALSTLRSINSDLATTQERIGSGLKISSGKDNAAYFTISQSMKGDSSTYAAIEEGLTLTKNSISTARMGAEEVMGLAKDFRDKISFGQGDAVDFDAIERDLNEIVKRMETTLDQSTFNGDDMVAAGSDLGANANTAGITVTFTAGATAADPDTAAVGAFVRTAASTNTIQLSPAVAAVTGVGNPGDANYVAPVTARDEMTATKEAGGTRSVVTGISRAGDDGYRATSIEVDTVDLKKLVNDFKQLAKGFAQHSGNAGYGEAYRTEALKMANEVYTDTVEAATKLGQSEKSIDDQQEFLKKVTANIDTGVGAMVDADMEAEAARLQALQVQQQLATQSLSIANQGPQSLLSLFR